MDAVSGATERPCPHRSRVVTHGYEDIYSRSTPDAKLFQSGISPKVAKNLLKSEKLQVREHVRKLVVVSRLIISTRQLDFLYQSFKVEQ